MLTCTQCGRTAPEGRAFCAYCGSTFPTPAPPKATVTCPNCGTETPDGAKFCNSCGTNLQAPTSPVAIELPPALLHTQCQNCGAELILADKFCSSCGASVASSPTPEPTQATSPPHPSKPIYAQGSASASAVKAVPLPPILAPSGLSDLPKVRTLNLWALLGLWFFPAALVAWTKGKEAVKKIDAAGGQHPDRAKLKRASTFGLVISILWAISGTIWLVGFLFVAWLNPDAAKRMIIDDGKPVQVQSIWELVAMEKGVSGTRMQLNLVDPSYYQVIVLAEKVDGAPAGTSQLALMKGHYTQTDKTLNFEPGRSLTMFRREPKSATWDELLGNQEIADRLKQMKDLLTGVDSTESLQLLGKIVEGSDIIPNPEAPVADIHKVWEMSGSAKGATIMQIDLTKNGTYRGMFCNPISETDPTLLLIVVDGVYSLSPDTITANKGTSLRAYTKAPRETTWTDVTNTWKANASADDMNTVLSLFSKISMHDLNEAKVISGDQVLRVP